MRALVTGGAGFIGSNLTKRLIKEDWDVTVVDDLSAGELSFLPKKADVFLTDFSADVILKKVRDQEFDVVFHLAAKPRVSYSCEHPFETQDINVNRMVRLLEACKGNVRRFVNTSSSSVYGGACGIFLPTHENYEHSPQSPYALQKSITEQYCMLFADLYDMETVSIRPFNVFGPNQLGDNPYACAVSAWLYAVKHGKPLRSDGDGTQTRDITYVDNVVDVFVRAAKSNMMFRGRAYNAGTGTRISNNEVLTWFKERYPKAEIVNAPTRAGDVKDTQADMHRSAEELGWKVIVPFWSGLEKTRDWAMTNPLF